MNTVRAINVKYVTDADGGSFVQLKEYRHEKEHKVTINWSYDLPQHTTDQAICWLQQKGFNIIGVSELKNSYLIISDTFYNDKEEFLYLKK